MSGKTHYIEQVYAVTQQVPKGRITTYGAIAGYLALGAARMVGWALNNSFALDHVPAHRVVNRKGELSGRIHFATPTLMQELLEHEGVAIENDTVVNFEAHFWDPAKNLGDAFLESRGWF